MFKKNGVKRGVALNDFVVNVSYLQFSVTTKMVAGAWESRKRPCGKDGFTPRPNGIIINNNNNTNCEGKNGTYDHEMEEESEETPFYAAVMTYLSYFFLVIFGYMHDFARKYGLQKSKAYKETGNQVRKYLK